eukprot:TRINITY_DN67886_c1_g1_i4.p1 TRINITY_DN67886_c1_g1~~TRINITY_DN67886_c1_g1_i4.p1  ORF type:complete len:694 (+),score=60.29 TRINITY_DN67886_c1_g1_i4:261-2342(+)
METDKDNDQTKEPNSQKMERFKKALEKKFEEETYRRKNAALSEDFDAANPERVQRIIVKDRNWDAIVTWKEDAKPGAIKEVVQEIFEEIFPVNNSGGSNAQGADELSDSPTQKEIKEFVFKKFPRSKDRVSYDGLAEDQKLYEFEMLDLPGQSTLYRASPRSGKSSYIMCLLIEKVIPQHPWILITGLWDRSNSTVDTTLPVMTKAGVQFMTNKQIRAQLENLPEGACVILDDEQDLRDAPFHDQLFSIKAARNLLVLGFAGYSPIENITGTHKKLWQQSYNAADFLRVKEPDSPLLRECHKLTAGIAGHLYTLVQFAQEGSKTPEAITQVQLDYFIDTHKCNSRRVVERPRNLEALTTILCCQEGEVIDYNMGTNSIIAVSQDTIQPEKQPNDVFLPEADHALLKDLVYTGAVAFLRATDGRVATLQIPSKLTRMMTLRYMGVELWDQIINKTEAAEALNYVLVAVRKCRQMVFESQLHKHSISQRTGITSEYVWQYLIHRALTEITAHVVVPEVYKPKGRLDLFIPMRKLAIELMTGSAFSAVQEHSQRFTGTYDREPKYLRFQLNSSVLVVLVKDLSNRDSRVEAYATYINRTDNTAHFICMIDRNEVIYVPGITQSRVQMDISEIETLVADNEPSSKRRVTDVLSNDCMDDGKCYIVQPCTDNCYRLGELPDPIPQQNRRLSGASTTFD